MIQRLLILLFLSLFLTACGTTSSDSADNDDNTNLPETQVFDSLSKASKDADAANEEQSHIFNAIGVQAEYRDSTLDISNVSSKLELTFDENGDMSSVKFGNATPYPYESYNINAEYSTPIELDGYLKIGGTDDNPSSSQIIVTRDFNNGSDENDFISEYMVGANWRDTGDTSATSYDRGFLVAGFETTGSAIPTNGTAVEFTGNGEGYYQGDGSYYSVAFDVSATVNFQLYNVALETSNSDGYDITDGSSSSIDHLNFAGILRYNSETNTLTGNDFITTGTDDDIDTLDSNELSGSANARFYGPAAEELGGTFRMSKSTDDYYYGYFGATSASNAVMTPEPAEPVVAHMIETTTMPAASGAPAVNHGGYASLNAALSAAVAGTDVTISMAALAVQSADMYTYTRPDNQTAWDNEHQTGHKTVISKIGAPILSITYKENPEVIDNSDPSNNAPAYNSISSVSPYVSGNRTSTANGEYDFFGHSYYGTIDSAAADKTSFVITSSDISASTDVNTRETQYMIRLTWLEMTASNNIIDDLSTTDNVSTVTAYEEGYLIAGFETTGAELAMVTDTAVSFTGAGAGSYNSPDSPLTDSNGVTFDVSATVDFVSYTVGLTTTNTAGQNCVEGVGSLTCTSVPLSDLNFTSNLTFAASTNVISGNVSADGMSGSVDARFY
ncbi:MAG: transferrin-binding protein-like solute binding protein, partial [Alphaproteobacteria bacterium]|nr:transferrin-binding protein-like solute binding protein [Alphaproteobacteria bacterium]